MRTKTAAERQLEVVQEQLETLQLEYKQLESSSSYRLGRLLTKAMNSPKRLLSLPRELWRLVQDVRSQRKPPTSESAVFLQLKNAWKLLANKARNQQNPVVFLFSGTTFIQGTRGNRPIRQTQALLADGVNVLFSYYRARFDDPLPSYQSDGLVQMPQDVTLQLIAEIAKADLAECPKLFIISYPYPGIEQQVTIFKQQGWTVIYDCRDDWEEFSKVGMARWFKQGVEKELIRQCDRTICVSSPLVDKMAQMVPESQVDLVPNAVESDFLPLDYRHSPVEPSTVGYFGHLSEAWFDWESFALIASNCSHLQFEVIGHSDPLGLDLPANVQLLGPKPWHELHLYASRWKVAMIPFRMGRLADGVDPIKIYEYLSFGLPVVSFRMPQINDYPYTKTVDSVADFCAALELATKTQVDINKIQAFIKQNTWEIRAKQLISYVMEKH